MADAQGSVRMNITTPAEVKQQMDAAAGVNWSAVATAAFRAKLLEIRSQAEATTMDEVIARLKAAAEVEDNTDYQDGKRLGESWAKEDASPRELRRLAEAEVFMDAELIAQAVWPRDGSTHEFWEGAVGEDEAHRATESDVFVRGFVEGALGVWNAVKSKI